MTITSRLKNTLREQAIQRMGHLYVKQRVWRYWHRKRAILEEVFSHVNPDRASIDVGANIGVYTALLSQRCLQVYSYEPEPSNFALLSRTSPDNSTAYQLGLSDCDCSMELATPIHKGVPFRGRSSMEQSFSETSRETSIVQVTTLDDRGHNDVGFIKIDVEGHESKTLAGATMTLKRDRPAIWIEIEQQHRSTPVSDVFNFLADLGYQGRFTWQGRFIPVSEFEPAKHQSGIGESPDQARDFLFVAK